MDAVAGILQPGEMSKIVISYRRGDSDGISGRIRDRLMARFGRESVFMDIDSIPFGVNFQDHFTRALSGTNVLLVIIGARWLGLAKSKERRIDDKKDFVRMEVEKAIELKVPILPVLVEGAEMPPPSRLPASLYELSFLNAAEVDSGRDFDHHIERLFRAIDGFLGASTKLRSRHNPIGIHQLRWHDLRWMLSALTIVVAGASFAIWWLWPSPAVPSKSIVTPDGTNTAVSCEEEKNLRSLGTQFATNINFNNASSQAVRLYWINHQGARELYDTLARGETRGFQTYITHPWLAADLQDKCLGIYMPAAVKLEITIR
jgi:hypothetical protein